MDNKRFNRRSIRLPDYDYTQNGAYFVTICTQNRQQLFCNIDVGAGPCAGPKLSLNAIGMMVQSIWDDLPRYYPGVEIDEFIIMPDHFHGIIILTEHIGRPQGAAPTSLFDVVHRFKSLTTARYRQNVVRHRWPPFPGRLWQRNYFERVIRNEYELDRIRQYIRNNPIIWPDDNGWSD